MTTSPPARRGTAGSTGVGAVQRGSERAKLRRGLAFLAMTAVLPGSAQLAGGHRRVGRAAVRVWVALWVLAAAVAVLALVWRRAAFTLATSEPVLVGLQVLLVVAALAWGLLFVDAWRLARPPELARDHRLGFAVLSLALALGVSGALVASASIVSTQRTLVASVFAGGGDTRVADGRYNVLLLGGDAGKTRVGLRPDSLTVASVDARTGRTVLVSLPRNMEDVPFPAGSPLREEFPRGFGCPDHSCMLNAVYTYATEHRDLYPGVADPGVQATKEAVEGATGLKINYYVLVDLKGFESLVDAVGGVTLDIGQRVPVGGGSSPVLRYIEPGRAVHLDGKDALWFARSREGSSDYERMARQKCVMSAMLNQLDPLTVLANFNRIAAAGSEVMATDVPAGDVDTLVDLALQARGKKVSSLALVPPLVHPGEPDFDEVRAAVAAKIARSERLDDPDRAARSPADPASETPAGTRDPQPSASPKRPATKRTAEATSARPDTEDLGEVCTAR